MSRHESPPEEGKRPRWLIAIVGTVVLLILGTGIGFLASEAIYRAYLYTSGAPDRFVRPLKGGFAVHNKPMWRYDARFGYQYPKGEAIHQASISAGRVKNCRFFTDFNDAGNIGRVEGDYAKASLKILVFGDSFSATAHDGVAWPHFLQRSLAKRLNRTVHVINYGRDGYGILQMFDLAAAKVAENKPDLAIIAFITNDLQRVRFWRAVTKVGGRWRHLVSPEATPNPDPAKSYDTAIYHPAATPEWCQKLKASRGRDRVIEDVEYIYNQGVAVGEKRTPSVTTLQHSYLIARIRHGDPFKGVGEQFTFPVIQYDSYAQDRQFLESLEMLRATGVRFVLFHMAFYPEIRSNQEYILTSREADLLRSLSHVTAEPIYETLKYVEFPVEEPERLINSARDYHPSLAGLAFYAEAIAEMLIRERIVQ